MTDFQIRSYTPSDAAACVELMRGNVPRFFHDSEVPDFERFLSAPPGPYIVIERAAGELLACGGYLLEEHRGMASLAWGMVDRDLHRGGLGTVLLRERLRLIGERPDVERVRMDTSQHSRGFYERFGFAAVEHVKDGYGPGLDRYEMRLEMRPGSAAPPS